MPPPIRVSIERLSLSITAKTISAISEWLSEQFQDCCDAALRLIDDGAIIPFTFLDRSF